MQRILFIIAALYVLYSSSYPNIEMVYVEGGSFQIGSNDICADPDEQPLHNEYVHDFFIGKYEVTQAQWKRIMKNPSYFRGNDLPVECVSWDDIQIFIKRLNAKTGQQYRLPTETEWEYAAKGGHLGNSHRYSGSDRLEEVAWFLENSDSTSHKCGNRQPNELGIYDMCGNVHEWCSDYYDSLRYNKMTATPVSANSEYVFRGGSWLSGKKHCRIANRDHTSGNMRHYTLGFRLAADSIID